MDSDKMRTNSRHASRLLKALSNEHRLLIMCQLAGGEQSVGELERLVGLSQSALSQHLARLRQDGLVRTRREAQTIHYSLAGDHASRIIEVLYDIYCGGAPTETRSANLVDA
jgi:DNA-binding transcriptional ArsR family regulator